jgi:hypothetical protein
VAQKFHADWLQAKEGLEAIRGHLEKRVMESGPEPGAWSDSVSLNHHPPGDEIACELLLLNDSCTAHLQQARAAVQGFQYGAFPFAAVMHKSIGDTAKQKDDC